MISLSDRPCVPLFKNSGIITNDDEFQLPYRGIILGTGGDSLGGTAALVRGEDTGEYYPEPSAGSHRLSDGGVGGSFDTCRLRFEFQCDVGSRVEFRYGSASEEYGTGSTHEDAFEVLLNRKNVALIPGDNDWHWDSAGMTVAEDVEPGWNEIEFGFGDGGDDGVDSWAFLEAGSFSCVPSITLSDGVEANGSADDEADTDRGSLIPLVVAVVVAILLVMIAMWLALIYRHFDDAQATPVESPAAAEEAAANDNESQCRRITSITIVSPSPVTATIVYYPWYHPYTWYNTYNYR